MFDGHEKGRGMGEGGLHEYTTTTTLFTENYSQLDWPGR